MTLLVSTLTCGIAVILAGIILGRSADAIAASTGLGRVWTGAVLLAAGLMVLGLATVARGPLSRRFARVEPAGGLMVGSYVLSLWLLHVCAR